MRRAGSRWRLRTLRGCLATRAATWRTSDSAMRSACGGWRGRGTRRPRPPAPGSKTPTPTKLLHSLSSYESDSFKRWDLRIGRLRSNRIRIESRSFAGPYSSVRLHGSTFYMERKCADTIGTVLVPMSWPFPTLKYKYISQIKIHGSNFIKQHSEAVTV